MSKIIIGVATALFAGLFAWILISGAPLDWAVFFSDPWVTGVFGDLMYGFVLTSVVIALVEGSVARAAPWIIALFIIGNLVTGVFLFLRFEKIAAAFRRGELA